MMRVGLTGGIGSGKSTVAGYFRDLGIPVYDSDTRARELMEGLPSLRDDITALLGPGAYTNGRLNRAYIAERVFNDPDLLAALNTLVHPAVRSDFQQWSLQQQAPYVLQEAAVLFENGGYKRLDHTILVTAPESTRVRRVMKRDQASREAVLARMKNQWDDLRKIPLADFVIENTRRERARSQARKIHRKLLKLSGSGSSPDC